MYCNTAKFNHHRLSNSGVTGRDWFRLPGFDRFLETQAFRVKGAPQQELPPAKIISHDHCSFSQHKIQFTAL